MLRIACGGFPCAQTQDDNGSFAIGHCTKNVKRISCVWLPDLRVGSLERRYSAMPAPARRNKKPSLRKRRDGMIRGATLIEGAKRLPLKTVNAGQTYRTTASTRVPPVCRRVSVPPVPLAAPFQPRGASLSRHRWEFPVDHALLFLQDPAVSNFFTL